MRRLLASAALIGGLWAAPAVQAQNLNLFTVTSCGSQSLPAGQFYPGTQDTTGKLCGNGGGAGGSTVVTQPTASLLNTTDANSAAILAALNTLIGQSSANFGGHENVASASIVLSTGSRTIGQSVGGVFTLAIARTTSPPSGVLNRLSVRFSNGNATAVTLYLYSRPPTASCTDAGTFTEATADAPYRVQDPVSVTPSIPAAGSTASTGSLLPAPVSFVNSEVSVPTVNLYGCIVADGTVTFASSTTVELDASAATD